MGSHRPLTQKPQILLEPAAALGIEACPRLSGAGNAHHEQLVVVIVIRSKAIPEPALVWAASDNDPRRPCRS
jgi:hypothetical protein